MRSFYITLHTDILKDECKCLWICILHTQKTGGERQIKNKYRKLKGKGVERAKEKLKLKIDKAYVHTCASSCTPAYSGMLSPSPAKPDIKAVVQLFLIHSIEKL